MSNNYQRLFYILKNMDSDVGYPTGYLKVEINCDAAKLQISLNNLLNRQGLIYRLYGIKKDDKQLTYTVICDVPNENGRADVKINADIHRIGSTQLKLDDINIFAIITQLPYGIPSIKCPLVAYTKGDVSWKREFETLILNKELTTGNDNISKIVTINKTKSDIIHEDTSENIGKINNVDDLENQNETEQLPDILAEIGSFHDMNGKIVLSVDMENGETKVSEDNETAILEDMENGKTAALEEVKNSQTGGSDNLDAEIKISKDMQTDDLEILEYQDNLEQAFDIMEDMTLQNDAETYTNKNLNIAGKFESAITDIYNTHKSTVLGQEKTPEAVLADNDILSSVQKNFNDISSIEIDADNIKNELNMPSLKEELDKSFESYNPFKMKSKNFKWWKINSPGYLNNILFRHNIKTYLLFNPKVMLAHYKYRYIIFGIRNDKHSGKDYLLCGVPGVYSIDENPFGNIGSWAQMEGYKPKYGAFGYWVILIDPRTGKLIKVK